MSVGGIWQSERVEHRRESRAEGLLLAAAVGDALGWPFERRARRVDDAADAQTGPFFRWERNAGNRFRSLPEVIEPGEYSDDTQMVIAVARSRVIAGENWPSFFRKSELPFFLGYERGAGAAVKRACRAWAAGTPPWQSAASADQYFSAGANGAAMRVAPHVLWHAGNRRFEDLADDVAEDAISTHGHPRAIIGALLHAFAQWKSLSQPAPIPYGWLLRELIDHKMAWSRVPRTLRRNPQWLEAAEKSTGGYPDLWRSTSDEVLRMLRVARDAAEPTSLQAPADVLADLGASRGRETGSGTVTAVGAAYLATYNAAAPDAGLQTAARLKGADTDTLASMTATLLAAAVGTEWIMPYRRYLQDAELIHRLSVDLLYGKQELPAPLPTGEEMAQMLETILHAEEGHPVHIPGGRTGAVIEAKPVTTNKGSGRRVKVESADGQTMFFISWPKEVRSVAVADRVKISDSVGVLSPSVVARKRQRPASVIHGVDIFVRDLPRARQVLEGLLELTPDSFSPRWVRYGTTVLRANADLGEHAPTFNLRVETAVMTNIVTEAQRLGLQIEHDYGHSGAIGLRVEPGFVVIVRSSQ